MRRGIAARWGSAKRKEAERKKLGTTTNRVAAARRKAREDATDLVEDELWLIAKGVLCALSWLLFIVFSILRLIDKRAKHMWAQFWWCSVLCVLPTTALLIWPHIPGHIIQEVRNRLRWRAEARRAEKGLAV